MGGNYLFSFTRGVKSKSQITNYNLATHYDVYSILGENNKLLVKWANGTSKSEAVYTHNEVNDYLKNETWIKINN